MEILAASNLRMAKTLIDQFFCHYERLEEYTSGMWRRVSGAEMVEGKSKARHFMMDTEAFSSAMLEVCEGWPNSCKVNFTDNSINPISWLGQAALCYKLNLPESVTRAAWVELPFDVQERANAYAKAHIKKWRKEYIGQGELFNEF